MNATTSLSTKALMHLGLAALLLPLLGCGTSYYEAQLEETVMRVRKGEPAVPPSGGAAVPGEGEGEPAEGEAPAGEEAPAEQPAPQEDPPPGAAAAAAARGANEGARMGPVGRAVLAPLD